MLVSFDSLTSVTQTEISSTILAVIESLSEVFGLQNGMGYLTVCVPYHTYKFLEDVEALLMP